ncbi:hypothetical protein HID58_056969 [Brassica napus]|uniref:Uncharacterized protein n=1 Tax=Brassica napus TaxID=3708 RepID=A0ABQ8APS0_BRANA|nr:hypothetical protein HID58_056969 [Brassica napus]
MLPLIYYIFQRHHIFTAKNEEGEHGDMKPASISEVEAKEIFFIKLSQSKDTALGEKVVCLSMVIIVTSSLIRDMNSKIDMYRGNGITILCRIDETPFPHPSNHPKRVVKRIKHSKK